MLQTDGEHDRRTADNRRSEKLTWTFSSGELKTHFFGLPLPITTETTYQALLQFPAFMTGKLFVSIFRSFIYHRTPHARSLIKCYIYNKYYFWIWQWKKLIMNKLSTELHVDCNTINTYSTWKLNMQLTRHCYTSRQWWWQIKSWSHHYGHRQCVLNPLEVHVQISAYLFMYKGCNVKTQN